MRIVTAQELESWLASGKVLEKDARGPKVVVLENGLFLKIFHTRRHPLIARIDPDATRFACNNEKLQQLSIPAPEVTEIFWLDRTKGLSGCLYSPLPGESIERIYRCSPDTIEALLKSLAEFIRNLHRLGVYFRSLHLGNIIVLPDGCFGLIDTLDLRFKRRALSRWQIKRNFRHLKLYLERHKLEHFPFETLHSHYLAVED